MTITTIKKYTGPMTGSENLGREVGKEVFPEYNPPFNKNPYEYNRIFGEGYHNNENFRNYNTNMPKLDYPFLKEELVYRNIKVKKPSDFQLSEHDKISFEQSIEFAKEDDKERRWLESLQKLRLKIPQKVEKKQRIKTKEEKDEIEKQHRKQHRIRIDSLFPERKERFILNKSLKGIYKKCCGDYGGRTINGEYCLRSIYLNSDGLCKDHY